MFSFDVHDRGKAIQAWREAFLQGSLLSALRVYWRDYVPLVCKPTVVTENKSDESRDKKIHEYLFGPLEEFLCGGDPDSVFDRLKESDKPQQICGHVFKSGEPTYSCRECGVDATCVMCIHCFEKSSHRNHRYRMSTSGGGGYCDCGDVEAWKFDPFCERHKVQLDANDSVDSISTLPEDLRLRAEAVFNGLLRHTLELLVWESDDKLPEGMHVEELNDEFTTMLFNDEVHTYEQVISTLKRAVHCTQKQAVEFATTVDREGRSCVYIGSYNECDKAKVIIEKSTSRLGNKPLKVQVLHSSVVSQQMFAIKILQWLQTIISKSDGLRELFCRVSMEPQLPNHVSLLEEILRMDTSLWKAARVICHKTIMAAILLSPEYKRKFAILFTQLYQIISSDYIKDDHDHSVCVVSESIQLYTVPSLARMLIEDYDLIRVILSSFLQVCETKKKHNGKFAFDRSDRNQSFRRAQYMLHDLKYALSVPPKSPDEWSEKLCVNFRAGFHVLLELLSRMQGMDAVTRQTGQHIEFEPEWEGAFNLQLRLDDTLTLFLLWCETHRDVLVSAYKATAEALYDCRDPKYKLNSVKFAGHEAQVVKYDVSSQPISIHLPLSRLLAGLHLSLAKFNLSFNSPEVKTKYPDFSVVNLFEHALRVQVMIAQTHAGMWRRNGFSLLNQIYFYSNVKCRREMYDRDILVLQAGAALMNPEEFMIHLINKFGLLSLLNEDYDKPSSSSEDLVRQVVVMAEEMLNLLIIIISERFNTSIGEVHEDLALKREIVHQLCCQPMAHSELNKLLPDDPKEDPDLDRIIDEVAVCKEVGSSGKKMFELRPQFLSMYNPYFYHYHRSDQTKSEEEQRKRKKAASEDQALPPPVPPKFKPAFEPIVSLLHCDVMIYVMKLILKRSSAQRSRSWSEAQLERILHLIGLALHEDKRHGEEGGFPFTKKAIHEGILSLLEALVGHENVAHGSQRDLLTWVLSQFHEAMKLKDDCHHPRAKLDSSVNDEKVARDREKKAKLAEKRRKQLLEQMSKMQKNFILENAELFENTDSDIPKENAMDVVQTYQFPVCVGPNRNEIILSAPSKSTCILCQEQQEVTKSGRAMVLATYSQKSTVLSKRRGEEAVESADPLFMFRDLQCGTFTSTCGHVMHSDCWQRFFDSVVSQERRRMFRFRHYPSFDIEKMEFLCPLCETISNSVMPIIPPLLSPGKVEDIDIDFDSWLNGLLKTIDGSRQHDEEEDVEITPLALVSHLLGEKGDNFSKLFAAGDTEVSFSESVTQMVRKMARDVYSVNMMTQPDDGNNRVPIYVWQTCAYSIEALERGLVDEGKPLFGALSSRQSDCLRALVKMTVVVGQMIEPRQVKGHCLRLINAFLTTTADVAVLDLELFHTLVSLASSLPLLYSEVEKFHVSNAGLNDQFLIQLTLVARMIQIMEITESADSMETDEYQDSQDEMYRVYQNLKKENLVSPQRLKELMNSQILSFLRCTALFYHFLTDIPPPDELFGHHEEQSLIIRRYLGLPQDLSDLFTPRIIGLIQQWTSEERTHYSDESKPELVPLPDDYSQLINKLCTFTCPNSDGDDSRAPTMCLVCGDLLCSQSYCCQMDLNGQMVGAATEHAHRCGAGIGIFLRVRECQVLLLASRTKGCFLPAPYLDRYGETDQLLRRGNPLFLSADRYKKLQKLWLSHGIPEEIAHQLESNTNLMTYEWHNL